MDSFLSRRGFVIFLAAVVIMVLLLPAELSGGETNLTPVLPQPQKNEGILSRLMENKFPVGVKYYGKIDAEVIRELKETNVNVVFCNPTTQGRQLLRENDIAFFLNVSVFHAPDEVAKDKTLLATDEKGSAEPLDTWQKIVCPTRKEFRTNKIKQIIEEVKKLSPDGVSLDFIRFPVYWEMVKPEQTLLQMRKFCFCRRCLGQFYNQMQISIPQSLTETSEQAGWILKNHRQDWEQWKCGVITSMVKQIRDKVRRIKPDILIDIHAVPWRLEDFDGGIKLVVGQDFKQLAPYVDVFSPMCYHHMLWRKPEWIHSVVAEISELTQKSVWPCIQVKQCYRQALLSQAEYKKAILEALKPPSGGMSVFHWGYLKEDEDKRSIFKSLTLTKRYQDKT